MNEQKLRERMQGRKGGRKCGVTCFIATSRNSYALKLNNAVLYLKICPVSEKLFY
jgi:hypothetical protein